MHKCTLGVEEVVVQLVILSQKVKIIGGKWIFKSTKI